jgi:hypothetical protein
VVLSKGSEVVGLGYSRVTGVSVKFTREKIQKSMAGLTGLARRSSITQAGLTRLAKIATQTGKQIGLPRLCWSTWASPPPQVQDQGSPASRAGGVQGRHRNLFWIQSPLQSEGTSF